MPKTALIPLAPGFEEMEGIILADVLRRGGVEVVTASISSGPIVAARKTIHLADKSLEEVSELFFDLIVLPGGLEGTKNLQSSKLLEQMVQKKNERKALLGAICAAPNALRFWKIISGNDPFTAFPTSIHMTTGGVYKSERIVSHNHIHTSIGPGSAFEFSLFLLEKLQGIDIKNQVASNLYLPHYRE